MNGRQPLHLIQIVRRFGPVGGMERYVWELSRELAALGCRVTVLCEQLLADAPPPDIDLVELGVVAPKPRWLAHLRFSARVSAWLSAHPEHGRIIHSHERTAAHHFTTFHGPPFASMLDKPWWQRISPRVYANLWLERRELCAPHVRAVIPNSPLIAEALRRHYPAIAERIEQPIAPGVGDVAPRPARITPTSGGVIGFIGKEWKRKGLDIAVRAVASARRQRPDLQFIVAGPEPAAVRHLFADWSDGYTLLGETDSAPLYAQFDLLLHPARQEPYGMVIAEARAAGVALLVSDACGIADELEAGAVLPLNSGTGEWANAIERCIGQQQQPIHRSWRCVAEEQIACYRRHPNAASNPADQ